MKSENITFLEVLALIFIGLKLAGVGVVAAWPWWVVLAPIWVPCAAVVVILFVLWTVSLILQWGRR